jgi:hypothetical protein
MFGAGVAACAALVALGAAGCDARPQPDVPDAATEADAVTRELGPFLFGDVAFTVVLGVLTHAGAETVRELRIVDGAGSVHFEETFDAPATLEHGFARTLGVSAVRVSGMTGAALLIARSSLPSAPLTGETQQPFGVRDGRLQPLTPPLSYHGELAAPATGGDSVTLPDGDLLVLELWRYHFGVTLPLRLDLACVPGADTCIQPAPRRLVAQPEFGALDVTTELRAPAGGEFITLYSVPGDETGSRVPVHLDSAVQVLEAAARITMRSGDVLDVVIRDEHLRVRVDGREGWIRGPEAFEAIGLPAAG